MHELGHFLGAAHSRQRTSAMRPVDWGRSGPCQDLPHRFRPAECRIDTLGGQRGQHPGHAAIQPAVTRHQETPAAGLSAAGLAELPNDPAAKKYIQLPAARPIAVRLPRSPSGPYQSVANGLLGHRHREEALSVTAVPAPSAGDALAWEAGVEAFGLWKLPNPRCLGTGVSPRSRRRPAPRRRWRAYPMTTEACDRFRLNICCRWGGRHRQGCPAGHRGDRLNVQIVDHQQRVNRGGVSHRRTCPSKAAAHLSAGGAELSRSVRVQLVNDQQCVDGTDERVLIHVQRLFRIRPGCGYGLCLGTSISFCLMIS